MRHLILPLCLAMLACDDDETTPGQSGGECLSGVAPCAEGLACVSGTCVTAGDAGATSADELRFSLELDRTRLLADGMDAVVARVRVTEAATGDPYEGEILMTIDPPSAGEVSPARLMLSQGLGGFRITGCDDAEGVCPSSFVLYLSLTEQALDPVARSPQVLLDPATDAFVDAAPPPEDAGIQDASP
ncbi:MAG: hypothetical protein ACE366_30700 [Bradymonadia bacterium]